MEQNIIKILKKKKPIYYEYIDLLSLNKKYHLINIYSDEFNFLIPTNYNIIYSQSVNNYQFSGHICFFSSKNKFHLDYIKKEYKDFRDDINTQEKYITKQFINFRNQEFYELKKDNIEYIYMYFNGYEFKLSNNAKFTLNEYFDMYLILYSIDRLNISENFRLLKVLYYISEYGIKSIYDERDLLVEDLNKYIDDIKIDFKDIVISSDEAFLEYRKNLYKIEKIDLHSSNNLEIFNILKNNGVCEVYSVFDFLSFGKYKKILICNYNEITMSEELLEEEKITLIKKIIEQKRLEVLSNSEKIKIEMINFIVKYFKNILTFGEWNNYHVRDFIYLENLKGYNTNLTNEQVYNLFKEYVDINIINEEQVISSIEGEVLSIHPDYYLLTLSGLNDLFNSIKINLNEYFCLLKI